RSPLPTHVSYKRVYLPSSIGTQSALERALGPSLDRADALVMAAAVADHRPAHVSEKKTKKATGDRITLELVKNPDLLAEIGARRTGKRPVLVGFAVETEDLVGYARKKLVEKKVDLVVANLAAHGFGGDDDRVVIVAGK